MTLSVLWDRRMTFHTLVEDAAGSCDAVTPLIMAAPFFKGHFSGMIIPTGFGNTHYSKLLPALRACSDRIEDYLENGGKLLVFGAADANPDRYDWLPVDVEYHFEFQEHTLTLSESKWTNLFDGYDTNQFPCDGWFTKFPGKAVATSQNGFPVLVECEIGSGTLLLAGTHEYPSDAFLKEFAKGEDVTF